MTLCAIMRHGAQIHLATDSRLNWGATTSDAGVKVMALPLHLFHATPEGENKPMMAHSRILGLATLGNLATTYIAKELLESILASIQFANGIADVSMAGIADVCARVLRNVSRDICAAIFDAGKGQLVLVGKCLVTNTARVFVLAVVLTSTGVDVSVAEVLTSDTFAFLGSGARQAHVLYAQNPRLFTYQVVRAVCNDTAVGSVGGNIQFGVLEGDDFKVMGIRDYRVNDTLKEIYTGFFIAGVEVYGGESMLGDSGFALLKGFVSPFERDILEYMERGYAGVTSTAHWV